LCYLNFLANRLTPKLCPVMPFLRHLHRFSRQIPRIGLLALLLWPWAPSQAHAALVFCNRTQQPIEAALGYRDQGEGDAGDTWISEGWWRIEPGQCSRVYGQPLKERFYFYYATALSATTPEQKPFAWAGKYQFCTDIKAFRVEGDGDCEGRGYRARGFQQIDLGPNTRDYTLDFRDGG
jgi:uncharacterized membrane protein